jgi:hypothetical protein
VKFNVEACQYPHADSNANHVPYATNVSNAPPGTEHPKRSCVMPNIMLLGADAPLYLSDPAGLLLVVSAALFRALG